MPIVPSMPFQNCIYFFPFLSFPFLLFPSSYILLHPPTLPLPTLTLCCLCFAWFSYMPFLHPPFLFFPSLPSFDFLLFPSTSFLFHFFFLCSISSVLPMPWLSSIPLSSLYLSFFLTLYTCPPGAEPRTRGEGLQHGGDRWRWGRCSLYHHHQGQGCEGPPIHSAGQSLSQLVSQ